jgi:NhaP-type Na+/H+ or K+/H+ antiporter
MHTHTNTIIILLSAIVILSYLFNLLSRATRVPSVLLLITTGIAIKYLSNYYGYVQQDVSILVRILGAIGLIMIVLEAALDLEINREKIKLIRDSFLSALIISMVSAFIIGWLIQQWLHEPFNNAFIYAIPMSIISSAIVIPSAEHLPAFKKEFVIYESSFSDIIGIVVFNYLIMQNTLSLRSGLGFVGNIGLAIAIAAVASILLTYILSKITINLKFFLLFAILSMVYSMGEIIHLPSLLIVLVFGLILNNTRLVFRGWFKKIIVPGNIPGTLILLKSITAETSFLLRTFFFILFGYSIKLSVLPEPHVWKLGSLIVLLLLAIRYLYLRFILKANLFPELFLIPRGLVTILLFYSIPADKTLTSFNIGILFYVIVLTSILMSIGLIFFKHDKKDLLSETETDHRRFLP